MLYNAAAGLIRTRGSSSALVSAVPDPTYAQGAQEPAQAEAPGRVALEEGAFRLVKDAHAGGGSRPGAYHAAYPHWLQRGLPAAQAYTERSAVHARACCFLQVPPAPHARAGRLSTLYLYGESSLGLGSNVAGRLRVLHLSFAHT